MTTGMQFFFFTADLEIHYIAITDFQITPV